MYYCVELYATLMNINIKQHQKHPLMNKKITVVLKTKFSLPPDAKVISCAHDDECALEHIDLHGMLLRPEVQWLALHPDPPQGLQYPHAPIWLSVEEDKAAYLEPETEEWYLEEEEESS